VQKGHRPGAAVAESPPLVVVRDVSPPMMVSRVQSRVLPLPATAPAFSCGKASSCVRAAVQSSLSRSSGAKVLFSSTRCACAGGVARLWGRPSTTPR
jgi:hypothetical protein